MTAFLLTVHVLAAILAVGPVAVAASLYPRAATTGPPAQAALLHRICRVYTVIAVAVPVFGIATGLRLGVMGSPWLILSLVLTLVAAGLLGALILPDQRRLLPTDEPASSSAPTPTPTPPPASVARRLAATTGVFNLLWVVVVVLMIVRPGSTTGV